MKLLDSRRWRALLGCCLALTLAGSGCTTEDNGVKSDTAPITPDAAADTTPPPPRPDTGPPDAEVAVDVCGKIIFEDNKALNKAPALVCDDKICYTGFTESDGTFCTRVRSTGPFAFHIGEWDETGPHYGETVFPLPISEAQLTKGGKIQVGTIFAPRHGEVIKLTPTGGGTATFKDGAKLVIGAGVGKPPLGLVDLKLSVGYLAQKSVHQKTQDAHLRAKQALIAVDFLPHLATFSSKIPFELPAKGLPANSKVDLILVDHWTGKGSVQAKAQVDAAGKLIKPLPGEGLTKLGFTLIVPGL